MGMSSNQGQSNQAGVRSFYEQAMERTKAMMEARKSKAGLGVANTVIVEPAVRPNGLDILKALASSEKPVGEMRGILGQVMYECDWCCLDAFEGDSLVSIDSESVFLDYLRFVLSDFLRPGTSRKRFRFAAEVIGEQNVTGNGNPESGILTTEIEFRISLNDDFLMKRYWLGDVKAVLSEWTEYLEDPQTGRSYRSDRWSLEIHRDAARSGEEYTGSGMIERLLPGGKVQRLVCDSLDLN